MANNSWLTVNIFLSSTFSDMQAERDVVRKLVVPRLNERLKQQRITVEVTDLRWGIDTSNGEDESDRESKVLHVCINAIKNTHPYFVALIGERYGWIPDRSRFNQVLNRLNHDERIIFDKLTTPCSVTEMEILLGAIGNQNMLDHSIFCFRDPSSYFDMDPHEYQTYVTGTESEESAVSRINALKSKIVTACSSSGNKRNIIEYKCKWNSSKQRFENLNDFANQLEQHILEDLIGEGTTPKELSETENFDNFFASNAHSFIGRKQKLDEILKITSISTSKSNSPLHGMILKGPSGVGKSYFLSALAKSLQKEKNYIILTHAAGLTPASVRTDSMFSNWTIKLQSILGEDSCDIARLVANAKEKGFSVIGLIDSLDSFALGDNPLAGIPSSIFVVATSLPDCAEELVRNHQEYALMSLEDFSREDAAEMIDHTFATNFKELTADIRAELLSKCRVDGSPSYSSPLWLNIALSMLMELGDYDFREIHKIKEDASQSIHQYLLDLIKSLPGDPDSLFARFIDMTCQYFNPELTIQALTYIAIAPFGIQERQLETLLGDNWNSLEFESLRQWLGSNMSVVGSDRTLKFSHAIYSRSLSESNDERIRQAREKLNKADWNDYKREIIDLDELVRRLIYRSEYDAVRHVVSYCEELLSNQGVDNFAMSVFKILENDTYTVVRFVDRYYSLFHEYDMYDSILYWVDYLCEEINRSEITNKEALLNEFKDVKTRYISRDRIFNGNLLDFSEFLSFETNYEAWRWALETNIKLYGYKILDTSRNWVFNKLDSELLNLSLIVRNDVSAMPKFIEKYVEAIEWAERIKSSMPEKFDHINKGIGRINNYLDDIFIGWKYESHPFHLDQVKLAARMKKIMDAPYIEDELPPKRTPSTQEVDAAVKEYKRLFLPSEVMEEHKTPFGIRQRMAQAEVFYCLDNRCAALEEIDSLSPQDRFTRPVLDWLNSRFPDSEILFDFYHGRYVRIMEDILLGKEIDQDELSRIAHIYKIRGENEKALQVLMTESEILFLRQREINFKCDDDTYESGNYIYTLDNVSDAYKALVSDMRELGFLKGAEEALLRWLEMCDLTYVDRPLKGQKDYEWAEKQLECLGLPSPIRKNIGTELSKETIGNVRKSLSTKFSNDYILYRLIGNINGDVLMADYSGYNSGYSAIFTAGGTPCSALDEYRYIIDLGDDELTLAGESRHWEFLRRDGKKAFDGVFKSARKFSEGLAAVAGLQRESFPRKHYWGFINTDGADIIPRIYEEVGDFHHGKAWAIKDGYYGVIDSGGNVIIDFKYDLITSFYRDKAYAFKNGEMIILE